MTYVTLYDVRDAQVLWTPVIVKTAVVVSCFAIYVLGSKLPNSTVRGAFARSALMLFAACFLLAGALQVAQTLQLRRDLRDGRYGAEEGLIAAAEPHQTGWHHQATTLLFRVENTWLQLPDETRSACEPQIGEPARVVFGLRRQQTALAVDVHPVMLVQLSGKTCAPAR